MSNIGASSIARRALFSSVIALVALLAFDAHAGSYLNRAVLLVRHARDEAEFLRQHVYDAELARAAQKVAEGRLRAARETMVPKEVAEAHPHLLLMLEAYERAAAAAVDGRAGRFLELSNQARDEEQIFRGILRQLGWPLPDEKK